VHRSPRVLVAWLIVGVVAIVTARVVAGDLAALHRRARSLGPDEPVLLAARELPLGAQLTPSDVRAVTRPRATVPPDAVRDVRDVVGRTVGTGLARDDVVRAVHLAPADRPGIDGVVPIGRRAIHVALKDGFSPPQGAVVDVLAAFDAAQGESGPAAAGPVARGARVLAAAGPVARGARVLAVDDAGESAGNSGTGVTLLVTEAEANGVAYAASTGDIVIALAPPETACCTPSSRTPSP
jgi:pilus assembly protein CpaB